jgi:hypothetical protein
MDNQSLILLNEQFISILAKSEPLLRYKYSSKEPIEIATMFGINILPNESNTNSIKELTKEKLCQQFLEIIKGDCLEYADVFKLYKNALFKEYYQYDSFICGTVLKYYGLVISLIRSINNNLKLTKNLDRWEASIDHLFAITHLSSAHCNPDWKVKVFANAIKYFDNLGYRFDLSFDKINLDGVNTKDSLKKIENEIELKVKTHGIHFYIFILEKLSTYNAETFNRVMFFKRFQSWQDTNSIKIEPLGLALKYAVKHKRKSSQITNTNDLQKTLDFIGYYSNLFQLYDNSMFDLTVPPSNYENYMVEIGRNIYFDQVYSTLQLPSKYFCKMSKIIHSFNIKDKKFQEELFLIEYLFTKFFQQTPHILNIRDISTDIKQPEKIINRISGQNVDTSFLSLFDDSAQKNRPVSIYAIIDKIYINGKIQTVFFNHPCLNLLLFEYLLNNAELHFKKQYAKNYPLKNVDKAYGNMLGKAFESLLSEEFRLRNISFLEQKVYNTENNPYLSNINEAKGETDFIIETDDYIVIIECKSKQLSHNSKNGDGISIFLDIFSSLISSQYQAKKVEYLLLQQGYIKFEDQTQVDLSNRKVITITASIMENFHSIMDKHFSRNIIEYFSCRQFTPQVELEKFGTLFVEVNSKLLKLNAIINANTKYIYFLSLQQIILLLEHSSSNNDFVSNLTFFDGCILNGYKDWYVDLKQLIDIKKSNPGISK